MGRDDEIGSIRVSDKMLAACVASSALSVQGVVDLDEVGANLNLDNFSRGTTTYRGVMVVRHGKSGIINIYLIAADGAYIPQLAFSVQKKVAFDITEITGVIADEINIHVQGVRKTTNDLKKE